MNHIKFKDPKTAEGKTIIHHLDIRYLHQFDLRYQISASQTRISSVSAELSEIQVHSTVGKV